MSHPIRIPSPKILVYPLNVENGKQVFVTHLPPYMLFITVLSTDNADEYI